MNYCTYKQNMAIYDMHPSLIITHLFIQLTCYYGLSIYTCIWVPFIWHTCQISLLSSHKYMQWCDYCSKHNVHSTYECKLVVFIYTHIVVTTNIFSKISILLSNTLLLLSKKGCLKTWCLTSYKLLDLISTAWPHCKQIMIYITHL